ncbi:MAG: DNA translocase FtsK 4TM domain-containing protein [Opitutaceae bacterium]|nr:DNA translocase FtsK 4TM domain-containing protein [Opitutaceae bacterium]
MAKSDSSSSRNGPSFKAPTYQPRWVAACLCLMVGLLLTVALAYYAPTQVPQMSTSGETLADGSPLFHPPTAINPVGKVGAQTAFLLFRVLGGAAWLIGFFFYWLAYIYTRGMRRLATARAVMMPSAWSAPAAWRTCRRAGRSSSLNQPTSTSADRAAWSAVSSTPLS